MLPSMADPFSTLTQKILQIFYLELAHATTGIVGVSIYIIIIINTKALVIVVVLVAQKTGQLNEGPNVKVDIGCGVEPKQR